MSKVTYGQRGYIGSSMSARAQEAYEDGEMPKSKWTKAAIVDAIKSFCDEYDLVYDPSIEKMSKADLWDAFIEWKSWHHTSKYANATDFYGIDEEACKERFEHMSGSKLAERIAKREVEAEEERQQERERDQKELARERAMLEEAKVALGPVFGYIAAMNPGAHDCQIVSTLAAEEALHPDLFKLSVSSRGDVLIDGGSIKDACTIPRFWPPKYYLMKDPQYR